MVSKLGWTAVGGFAVGVLCLSLVATLHADDLRGFDVGDLFSSVRGHCGDRNDATGGANARERRWTWDSGDEVSIAVPATVRYGGGEGDEVIARGAPDILSRL